MYITPSKLCIDCAFFFDCALILPPLLTVSCLKTVMMSYLFCAPDLAQCLAHNRCSINIWHTHKQAREMICLILVSWKWLIFGQVSLNSVKTHLFSIGVYTSLILCLSIHPSIHYSVQHLLRFYHVPVLIIMVTKMGKTVPVSESQSHVGRRQCRE